LAAHRGIDGGQKGGGNLHKGDAAQVGGGGKAGQVPHHAAAQGNHKVGAGDVILNQKIIYLQQHLVGFGVLPVGDVHRADAKARGLERFDDRTQVQPGHCVVGDDGGGAPAGGKNVGGQLPGAGEQALFDQHLIAGAGVDSDGLHSEQLLSAWLKGLVHRLAEEGDGALDVLQIGRAHV